MSEPKEPKIPAWQQSQSTTETEPALEQARKFLSDDDVRTSSIDKKEEFLKSKGYKDTDIEKLLAEVEDNAQVSVPGSSNPGEVVEEAPQSTPEHRELSLEVKEPQTATRAILSSASDAPPIITYPEFLTKSPRPPPLITPSRLANILTISGTLWTLLYGTAHFVVSPMVDNLQDARLDYYTLVNDKLSQLVEKLEGAASEVPYKNGKLLKSKADEGFGIYEDNESIVSDPTELFHRDIGTQTSPQPSPLTPLATDQSNTSQRPVDAQATRLSALRTSLRELSDMYAKRTEETADLTANLQEIREEVDKLAIPPITDFSSYGYGRPAEPDDEAKKTKDAIRSVKGLLLSARSFPVAPVTAR